MPSNALRLRSTPARGALADALAALTHELGLTREFPPEVMAEAAAVATDHPLPDADLTDVPFVTIDPEGAMDLDQAMHIERAGNGYRVRYAITDVPAFVAPGGAIDAQARRRGQTIYAPDGRIPLYPTIIGEGAASLLPGQLRGAYVWDFALAEDGTVTSSTVSTARVRSAARLDYHGVQRSIDAGTAEDTLLLLKEVGLRRLALEAARGAASLNIPEVEIEEHGGRYELERRQPQAVESWNAQISLMTGMAAAELMLRARIGILRTLPAPDAAAVENFRHRTFALRHGWHPDTSYGDYLRGLDTTNPTDLAIMHAAGSLFRGAGYTAFDGEDPADITQAAVAAPYAHATAPLRRLVDRFVLVACEALSRGAAPPAWVREALPTLPAIMASSGSLTAQLEHRAIETVEAALLSHRVGETFDAFVIAAGNGGGSIQLVEPAVTGHCTGTLDAGTAIRATLTKADIATGAVQFARAD